jgi:hypothetical protein
MADYKMSGLELEYQMYLAQPNRKELTYEEWKTEYIYRLRYELNEMNKFRRALKDFIGSK